MSDTLTRDQIRAQVLGKTHKPKSEIIDFFGTKIELRQPTLGAILDNQQTPDRQAAVIAVLVERAFVPGTDERVFEDSDEAVLRSLPFGKDFIAVNKALEAMSEVNFLDKNVNSDEALPE